MILLETFSGCDRIEDLRPVEDWDISDDRNAVIQDMLLYMGCALLHELQDAAAQGLCNFGLNGEFQAKTKYGYDAHWKVIKILVTDYESLFENGSRNWKIIG